MDLATFMVILFTPIIQDAQVVTGTKAKHGMMVQKGHDWNYEALDKLSVGLKGRLVRPTNLLGWWTVDWLDLRYKDYVLKTVEHRVGFEGFYDLMIL